MDEEERRNQASIYHYEVRQRVNNYPATSGRWILAASAAGALACFNGLVSADVPHGFSSPIAEAITGYVLSMALTSSGLQFIYAGDVSDMIFWGLLDKPCSDAPSNDVTDPLIKEAQKKRTTGGWLLSAGGFVFMMTTIWGAYQISDNNLNQNTKSPEVTIIAE